MGFETEIFEYYQLFKDFWHVRFLRKRKTLMNKIEKTSIKMWSTEPPMQELNRVVTEKSEFQHST